MTDDDDDERPRAYVHQPQIVFTKLHAQAKLPQYMTGGAAGADLFALRGHIIAAGYHGLIPTGLCAVIPPGYEVQIRPRSGLAAKWGLTVLNAPGTIDSDYTLEWKVLLINHGRSDFVVHAGDAIAQMVFAPVLQPRFGECVDGLIIARQAVLTTVRDGGFGSTSLPVS